MVNLPPSFDGFIAEVAMWNRVLTAAEIEEVYHPPRRRRYNPRRKGASTMDPSQAQALSDLVKTAVIILVGVPLAFLLLMAGWRYVRGG